MALYYSVPVEIILEKNKDPVDEVAKVVQQLSIVLHGKVRPAKCSVL